MKKDMEEILYAVEDLDEKETLELLNKLTHLRTKIVTKKNINSRRPNNKKDIRIEKVGRILFRGREVAYIKKNFSVEKENKKTGMIELIEPTQEYSVIRLPYSEYLEGLVATIPYEVLNKYKEKIRTDYKTLSMRTIVKKMVSDLSGKKSKKKEKRKEGKLKYIKLNEIQDYLNSKYYNVEDENKPLFKVELF